MQDKIKFGVSTIKINRLNVLGIILFIFNFIGLLTLIILYVKKDYNSIYSDDFYGFLVYYSLYKFFVAFILFQIIGIVFMLLPDDGLTKIKQTFITIKNKIKNFWRDL
ncbi:MAG: hypothetical protein K0S41_3803 [Anaerocolumna sp.]|nr:hypothetical protein [Anaerocolumna sp.]